MADDQKGMYVANRNVTISTATGHALSFKKDVPQLVPPIMRQELLQHGILPVNGDLPIEKEKDEEALPPIGDERTEAIDGAIRRLVDENDRASFGASGVPHVRAIEDIIGYDINAKERDEAWKRHNAA